MNAAAELPALERALDANVAELMRLAESGTNPAKVRERLFALQRQYEAGLQAFERTLSPAERDEVDDAIWTFRHRRLASLVTDELAAYIKLAAPRPSVASAFAKTPRPAAEPISAEAQVELHRCKTCGAPRQADGLYGNCLYCGRPFFNPRQEIE